MITTSELLSQGLADVEAGRHQAAVRILTEVLAREPRNEEALFHLLTLARQEGTAAGIAFVESVLRRDPLFLGAIVLLANLLRPLGRLAEALPFISAATAAGGISVNLALFEVSLLEEIGRPEAALQRLREGFAQASESIAIAERLASSLTATGCFEEALIPLRRCVELNPNSASAICQLGNGLENVGRIPEAMDCFATAVRLDPSSFEAFHLLGAALFGDKAYAGAIEAFRKALEINPGSVYTLSNLGVALVKTGRFQEGAEILDFVVQHQPGLAGAWLQLSVARRELGEITAALVAGQKAVELNPRSVEALTQRAATLLRAGLSAEAAGCFYKAHEFEPKNAAVHSDFLFSSNYIAELSPIKRFHYYKEYAALQEAPVLANRKGYGNVRSLDRKLRIGYMSGDFRLHSVAFFIEPILRAHDRSQVEIYAYSNRPRRDKVSDMLQSLVDVWRDIYEISDDILEDLIRYDQIDILVDLSGHTAHNRLLVFARKPAPVQITMIGCNQSTGLESVGYRITDAVMDPVGQTEVIHSERLLRMQSGPFVFAPPPTAPEIASAPCVQKGRLTFGAFNNTAKITPQVLDCWAAVLVALPDAALLLVVESDSPIMRALEDRGVLRERIHVRPRCSVNDYLSMHQEVDVLLDTFPYNGLTVTLLAAWMGVPCLTLIGADAAARAGAAINTRLGLEDWVVRDQAEFVARAKRAAMEPRELDVLRGGLRERVRLAFGDGGRFTRELEGVYKRIFGEWMDGAAACEVQGEAEQLRMAKNLIVGGFTAEAIAALSTILRKNPDYAEALMELGKVAQKEGRTEDAVALWTRAVELEVGRTEWVESLFDLLFSAESYEAAEQLCQRHLAVAPGSASVWSRWGDLCRRNGKDEDAKQRYLKAIEADPDNGLYADILVSHLIVGKDHELEVLNYLRRDGGNEKRSFTSWMLEGHAYFKTGRFLKAIEAFRKAIGLDPSDQNARANLGATLKEVYRTQEALDLLRISLRLGAGHEEMQNAYANTLQQSGDYVGAERVYREALLANPNSSKARMNLGCVLWQLGEVAEAIECFRKVTDAGRETSAVSSNLCFVMNYLDGVKPEEVFAEYRRFSDVFEIPLRSVMQPHLNDRNKGRRLRIGYVSADLRAHSVAYFAEPLFKEVDRSQFELFVYYNFAVIDPVAEEFRKRTDGWRGIHCVPDEIVERQIREDKIDILVELSGHTAGTRLQLFARKPAPIQVTMIGCMQSSGLLGMDYRISDHWMDPEGLTEHIHTEKIVRLKSGAFCLSPPEAPEVNPLPASSRGYIQFGSFNNLAKVTNRVFECWAKVLQRVPNSRLLVVGRGPDRIPARFEALGVDSSRIDVSPLKPRWDYMALHHEVDVLLDTFPYNGLTISSLAAWMGVPCVTIEGNCAAARAGSAIMKRLGLAEFVAKDEVGYVDSAVRIASNIPRLAEIRKGLRGQCELHLANAREYTAEIEQSYRKMWEDWCASGL